MSVYVRTPLITHANFLGLGSGAPDFSGGDYGGGGDGGGGGGDGGGGGGGV